MENLFIFISNKYILHHTYNTYTRINTNLKFPVDNVITYISEYTTDEYEI